MKCGFISGITVFLLVLSSGLRGQDSASEADLRYRVIDGLRSVNEIADAGYRIVSVARGEETVLLERLATPPHTYQYMVRPFSVKPRQLKMQLEGSDLFGFRVHRHSLYSSSRRGGGWIDITAAYIPLVLERSPGHPKHYQYHVLINEKIPILQIELTRASEQGYHVLGLIGGAEKPTVLLERPAERNTEPTQESVSRQLRNYVVLQTRRRSTLNRELKLAAASGYRLINYVFYSQWTMLLEKDECFAETPEYLLLHTRKASTLEKELNAAGSEGFRLLPHTIDTLDGYMAVMEKTPGPPKYHQYLILDPIKNLTRLKPEKLERKLVEASRAGYEPVALLTGLRAIAERPVESSTQ